jgi:hypothetical protein
LTNNAGAYNFANVPFGNDVTVTPVKDDDPLNGVTTYDLVIISKHILGVQLLDSPYKLIAADANKSNSVTTFDLVEIRRLILQIVTSFPSNTSWRFVDKDYVFPEPSDPWFEQFPEVISINDIPASVLDADFVAVKIGDVNGSAAGNLANGNNGDRNAVGNFVLTTDDRMVRAGDEVIVVFNGPVSQVLGYQFTLNFDREKLQFVELLPGVVREENVGFALLEKGALTTSWDGDMAGEFLFSLVFHAKASGRLSEMLSINSRFTTAEAYNEAGELLDVQLSFNGQKADGFELYQNMPNPFKSQTIIGFNLPEVGLAKLTISDISGKVVNEVEREFVKGYNEIQVNSNELPAFGVLYYTLKTATETATKKMIIVE